MLRNYDVKKLLNNYYSLLAILIGVILISNAMGPYRTLDTQLELSTAQGVLKWGYPYYNATGNLFNEPPLGFYAEAVYLRVFGVSEDIGVGLITLFGLGCTVMVYKLGKQLYNKTTGVFAAAFFALAPWELILSRSFLIDTQCLFLSLIYLYFGVEAVRKNSVKLVAVSGVFFALALLTKLYAVFMLVPLLILYLYQRPKNTKQILRQVGAFSLPAVFFTLLWYQVIAGKDLLYLIRHNDFKDLNFTWYTPTYAFVPNFLVNYGLGIFFFVAFVFSLAIGLLFWKRFQTKIIVSDLVCLATILSVLGLVMFMAINLDLKAPYTSAIKYIYQSLPFFCLAAASLATKSSGLIQTAEKMVKSRRVIFGAIGVSGLILLISLVLSNIITAQWLSTINYVVLRVQPNLDYGYSFYIVNPTSQDSPQQLVQYFGFLLVLSGLLWTSRHFISRKLCQIR